MSEWHVGQTVFLVFDDVYNRRSGTIPTREVTIKSIGRKWASYGAWKGDRFDIENGSIDGGNYTSPGRAWINREAYEEHTSLYELYAEFSRCVGRFPQKGVTEDNIREAARMLGIVLDKGHSS